MRASRLLPALAVVAVLAPLGDVAGQYRGHGRSDRPRQAGPHFGLSFVVAEPVGDFGRLVDVGLGANLEGRLPVALDGALALRADGGVVVYGYERDRVCMSTPIGCRIALDLTTTNNIFFLGAGPEIALPGPVSPYLHAGVGFSYFNTSSSLEGSHDHHDFARTEHLGDFVLSSRVGGGLRLRVHGGRRPIAVDLGAEYHRNGVVEYLVEGDIVDNPDGSITLFPNRSEADLMAFRVGITIGLGGDDHRPRRPRRRRRR